MPCAQMGQLDCKKRDQQVKIVCLMIVINTSTINNYYYLYLIQTHSGSVWKVTWAHPEFGQVLASCSFDRTAAVWEEQGTETTLY